MREPLAESQAGKLIFPEVVRRLLEAGVESYFCDQATGKETFSARDGKTHVEKMTFQCRPSRRSSSSSGLIAAIGGAQTDMNLRRPDGSEVRHVGCTMPPA